MDKRCKTCRHWREGDEPHFTDDGDEYHDGNCMRYPPRNDAGVSGGVFPVTMQYQRCGEWAPKVSDGLDDTAKQLAEQTLLGDLNAARVLADRVHELCGATPSEASH